MSRTAVFGGESKGSAQRLFRAEQPAHFIMRYGWKATAAQFALFPETRAEIRHDPRIRGWNGPGTDVIDPPAVVTLRLMDDVDPITRRKRTEGATTADCIQRARRAGQIVLQDLDDDIWSIPEWSPAKRALNRYDQLTPAYDLDVLAENMVACDGVICSTPRIADTIAEQVPQARTFVVRNGIDPYLFQMKNDTAIAPPVRIGWMGTASHHIPHVDTIIDALDVVVELGGEFIHLGHVDGVPSEDPSELYDRLRAKGLTVGWLDWGPMTELGAKLCLIDIGVIPRVRSPFNEGQSTSSGLEYAACGIPFLATRSDEYERLAGLGAGLVCDDLDDWRRILRRLMTNHSARECLGRRGREAALRHHGPAPTGRAYADLFRALQEERRA